MKLFNRLVATAVLLLGAAAVQAQEVRAYFITDAVGSPVIATDAYGNVTWSKDYLPYGERRYRSASSGANERWYTNAPQNEDTGLVDLGNRQYDPVIGRFLGVDPVGASPEQPFSVNRYAYANNNPYRFVDLDGREAATAQWLNTTNELRKAQSPFSKTEAAAGLSVALLPLAPIAYEFAVTAFLNPAMATEVTVSLATGDAIGPGSLVAGGAAISLTKAKFGHAFMTHSQSATEFLTKRAAGSGMPMGQFLDDQAAARLIQENLGKLKNGAKSIPIPKDFPARVIMPDGSFAPASSVRMVPSGDGVKTAYPEL